MRIFIYNSVTNGLSTGKQKLSKNLTQIKNFLCSRKGRVLIRVRGASVLIGLLIVNKHLTLGQFRCLAAEYVRNVEETQRPNCKLYWQKFADKTGLAKMPCKKRYILVPLGVLLVGGASIFDYNTFQLLSKKIKNANLFSLYTVIRHVCCLRNTNL